MYNRKLIVVAAAAAMCALAACDDSAPAPTPTINYTVGCEQQPDGSYDVVRREFPSDVEVSRRPLAVDEVCP